MKGKDPRNQPGVVTIGKSPGLLVDVPEGRRWLLGTHGNLGRIPKHLAAKLVGRPFKSFDQFREAFWMAVGHDLILAPQFSKSNQTLMKQGNAPKVCACQTFSVGLSERQATRPSVAPAADPNDPELGFILLGAADSPAESYILHHVHPIHAGGGVYELSNLVVITPRLHQEILAPDYHYKH
jgi:hypothetical protein